MSHPGAQMKTGIKHKLFLTLLFTSALVAVGIYAFMQWSFDRGFLSYVNSQELARLDLLAERLTSGYAEYGSWQFLKQNRALWRRMHNDLNLPGSRNFSPGPAKQRQPSPQRDEFYRSGAERTGGGPAGQVMPNPPEERRPPPPPDDLGGFGPRVVLFDANQQKIIGGPPGAESHLQLRPFRFQNEIIGFLGLIPAKELSDAGDLIFAEQQSQSFALVALAMVAVSLLVSFPLTGHLLRPIKALAEGTRKLNAGQFSTRIPVKTRDELGQLSDDFNTLAITLEKNEQARQQWVADISHELRTPLAVLRGEIEALQDGVRQPDPQTLEALHGEALHLGRLVDDLYELSMSDIGALTYRKVMADPVGLLEGTLELYQPRFIQRGLQLSAELPKASSPVLLADPDRLQQLFNNLLENSLRYTDPPGGLEIRAETGKQSVCFHFQDSAPGVLSEHLPRLFDRLYRVDESRARAKGGAGLGMAICKNIVEAHRGKIDAASSPQGGLWVRIELPLRV